MRQLKRQAALAAGIGVAGALVTDLPATSGWMHRDLAHNAYKLKPPLKMAARVVMWGMGMVPRDWAEVHRDHHKFADVEGDPHSPLLQEPPLCGLKLFLRNPFHFHHAVKERKKLPPSPDLLPDKWDRLIFDRTKLGLAASFAGHVLVNKASGNSAFMAPVSFAAEKVTYIIAGNLVNLIGHLGAKPKEALLHDNFVPHPDGTYGSDSEIIGVATLGEGWQWQHHDDETRVYFGPEVKSRFLHVIHDPVGAVALKLIDWGLAESPAA